MDGPDNPNNGLVLIRSLIQLTVKPQRIYIWAIRIDISDLHIFQHTQLLPRK